MDSLLESALNAAALRPNCHRHADRPATSKLYGIPKCRECVAADLRIYRRAFGTGLGPEAHSEANGTHDSIHHNDQKWRQAFPEPKYVIKERT